MSLVDILVAQVKIVDSNYPHNIHTKFRGIAFDERAQTDHKGLTVLVQALHEELDRLHSSPDAKTALAMLEGLHLWCGKAVKADQLYRELLEKKKAEHQ